MWEIQTRSAGGFWTTAGRGNGGLDSNDFETEEKAAEVARLLAEVEPGEFIVVKRHTEIPTHCTSGTAICWDDLPEVGNQEGGIENGRRYWCNLRNMTEDHVRTCCRTTMAVEYSVKI